MKKKYSEKKTEELVNVISEKLSSKEKEKGKKINLANIAKNLADRKIKADNEEEEESK